jgi:class 3 adenylate cyclase
MRKEDEWIRASEAVALLEPVLSPYAAQMRICERAHAGIVRARAEHFHEGSRRYQSHDIPEKFWWAEGHEALKQDWSAGDFSTWIDQRIELKAFGVTFARTDIEKIVPASTALKEQSQAISPGTKQKRKLAIIVALDVAGYSARTEADEQKVTAEVAALRKFVEATAAIHDGRVFNTAGDGFMLEFGSSAAGVEAAIELAEKCEPSVRVGVHLGDVAVQANGDLLGHGVNVAARLMGQADPGSVLVSADVQRTIHGPLRQSLRSLGMRKLDKMAETIEVFAFVRDQSSTSQIYGSAAAVDDRIHLSDAIELSLTGRTRAPGDNFPAALHGVDKRLQEVRQRASEGKLVVWGKRVEAGENAIWEPIPADYWKWLDLNWESYLKGRDSMRTGVAEVGRRVSTHFRSLQVGRSAFEEMWPKVSVSDARKTLWLVRKAGIVIRNKLIQAHELPAWIEAYEAWRAEVLKLAEVISADLYSHLETLNEVRPPPGNLSCVNDEHEHLVAVMSEILRRLDTYLERAATGIGVGGPHG